MNSSNLKKITVTALVTSILIGGVTVQNVEALGFIDVKDSHWAAKTINEFVNKGYIGGYDDSTFKPEKSITRAEFVKVVNKVFGYNSVGNENFTDIKPGQWYYNDICVAMQAGYIKGYEDNTFRPNNNITREEVAGIVTNIKKNKDNDLDKISKYADANKISNWAKTSVEGAVEAKYLGGYEDNTIRPKSNITRAESVVTLSRIPSDNEGNKPEATMKIMYTTGDPIVNVRKGPSTKDELLGTLPKGSKVEVVSEANGWSKVKFNGGYAYISSSYLASSQGQKPLPNVPNTPVYVDSPQHEGIISTSQNQYQSKIQLNTNISNGETVGMSLKSSNNDFNINYAVYSNGNMTLGSNGQTVGNTPIEAVSISLQGAPKDYHIFYRTKLKGQGWQAWVKDNTISGQIGNDSIIEDIEVRLVVSNNTDSMVKPTIGVDIGHNVPRPMLRGSISGIYKEDYLTKSVGEKVIYKLRTKGYNVVNTLPKGRYTQSDELKYRVVIANKNKVDKFISIHFNSFNDQSGNGAEVYYAPIAGSERIAGNIVKNISTSFGFTNRGIKPHSNLYVLQNATMPSVLVESCFITSQNDMDKFIAKGESAYDIMADAIVNGIIN